MPDADAEKGPALLPDDLFQSLDHAGDRIQAAPAIRKRADAGQHDMVGAPHVVGIGCHLDAGVQSRLAHGPLEGLVRGMQIARPIVDNGDLHRLGSGNEPITPSSPRANPTGAADGAAASARSKYNFSASSALRA